MEGAVRMLSGLSTGQFSEAARDDCTWVDGRVKTPYASQHEYLFRPTIDILCDPGELNLENVNSLLLFLKISLTIV